jgi:alpha-glucosidase (family GH31 glycosyl hydrolase)
MPIARPLYLAYPGLPEAYSFPYEYLLGNELLVSPVTDQNDSAATFLPPGNWFNYFTGELYKGNQLLKARYAIESLPLFVKQGSIIPLQNRMAY